MSGGAVFGAVFAVLVVMILWPELSRITWVRKLGDAVAWLFKVLIVGLILGAAIGACYFAGSATDGWLSFEQETRLIGVVAIVAIFWLAAKVEHLTRDRDAIFIRLERLEKRSEKLEHDVWSR